MSEDRGKATRSLERLSILTSAVVGLRKDLTAYRWTLDRYLRRGTVMVVALVSTVIALVVVAVAAVVSVQANDAVLEEMRRSEHEHRVRNEMLHACLVELVYDVVTTERGDRGDIPNPCPEPIGPNEIIEGAGDG